MCRIVIIQKSGHLRAPDHEFNSLSTAKKWAVYAADLYEDATVVLMRPTTNGWEEIERVQSRILTPKRQDVPA